MEKTRKAIEKIFGILGRAGYPVATYREYLHNATLSAYLAGYITQEQREQLNREYRNGIPL